MVAALAVSLVIAAWLYDAGRRYAGFDRSETEQELSQLRASFAKLEDETRRLRAIADASESRLKIEQSAQAQLGAQVKSLEEQNTRLKEDLAFFENLTPSRRQAFHTSLQGGAERASRGVSLSVARAAGWKAGPRVPGLDAIGRQRAGEWARCYNCYSGSSLCERFGVSAPVQVFSAGRGYVPGRAQGKGAERAGAGAGTRLGPGPGKPEFQLILRGCFRIAETVPV